MIVSDYCDVDPVFGSLADFDRLLDEAHRRGIRVLVDWVPAHTSSEHPWFLDARQSRDSEKRDWYIWKDPKFDDEGKPQPPNNWISDLTGRGPAWTFDEQTGQYYLHTFLPQQADLNWDNPELREAMHSVLRFWMDRGVDGFRADVVHNIGNDPSFADTSESFGKIPHVVLNDVPQTHVLLRGIRKVVDQPQTIELGARPNEIGGRMVVGEVCLLTAEQVSPYYGDNDELHLSFNFESFYTPWIAEVFGQHIERVSALFEPINAWPTWVLSNHDEPRHRTRHWTEDGPPPEEMARAAAVLLLTLRGTPFLYMGEELGLEDAVVPESQVVDPGGFRDGCRAPLPWDSSKLHGWLAKPWLPFPPDADRRNMETLKADGQSILNLYRRLLSLRRESSAFRAGNIRLLKGPANLLAYVRQTADDIRVVLINFGSEPVHITQDEEVGQAMTNLKVEFSSIHTEPAPEFDGRLDGYQALIFG